MSEWRDIETAPKDGRRIVAYIPDNGPYDPRVIAYWDDRPWSFNDWTSVDEQCGGERAIAPTHWMPLPSPPEPR